VTLAKSEPRWVPRAAVEAMHADLIRSYGGAHGLRDAGLLESALARPLHRWSYDASADIPALAAAYAVGIASNRAFIDGNKRTAFQAMFSFLWTNGLHLVAPKPEVVVLMRDVATKAIDEVALAAWVRAHVEAR
jgi:death-on-curing protein